MAGILSTRGVDLGSVRASQQSFFQSGATETLSFRLEQLDKLQAQLRAHETQILEALTKDLRKPSFEGYASDYALIHEEINYARKHLKSWMKKRRVPTGIAYWPARSYVQARPLGQVLIIGPWNYPMQLVLLPLVGAIAAGNTVVIKPSELCPHSSGLLAKIIGDVFKDEYISVFEGDAAVSEALLDQPWDHIFFTGSTPVGRIVAEKAAKHLTPTTLELGGKSPVFVTKKANIDTAAKRVVFGKFFNAGQTCVAPDYVLVDRTVHDQFLEAVKRHLESFFGKNPKDSNDLARIINRRHFQRLMGLLEGAEIEVGGDANEEDCYISPTVLKNVSWADKVMKDEIFGPIMPIIPYTELDQAMAEVEGRDKPLALYIFSDDPAEQEFINRRLRFGGGCINDTMVHVATHFLPFGGVGSSGQGAYHGKYSFERFSHMRATMKNPSFFDVPVRYPPYKSWKLKTARFLLG